MKRRIGYLDKPKFKKYEMRSSVFFLLFFKSINRYANCFSSAKSCSMEQVQPSPVLSIYYVTINNYESATKLSTHLVEKKLVACSNIVGTSENPITSIYSWQGNVEKEKEILLIMKSRTSLLNEIIKEVKANHPYSVPEIIATPIIGGNPDYIKWALENTKEPDA